MASISQGLVFTTAMVASSTLLYLAFCKHNSFPPFQVSWNSSSQKSSKQILRSCLSSGENKKETKKKKKKVKFADNVRESLEKPRKEKRKLNRVSSNCRNRIPDIRGMPANRIALYNGILRDRMHRTTFSY